MVAATSGEKPPASGAKMENGLFDSYASRKTRDFAQHCFVVVDLIFDFKNFTFLITA